MQKLEIISCPSFTEGCSGKGHTIMIFSIHPLDYPTDYLNMFPKIAMTSQAAVIRFHVTVFTEEDIPQGRIDENELQSSYLKSV